MKKTLFFSVLAMSLSFLLEASAQDRVRGILGQKAPAWEVDEWVKLPGETKTLDVKDYKGKVVYLYCFQSWCPGCHSSGFPTLQKMMKHYADAKDVAFVAVQTTFEGFRTNDPEAAKRTAKKYELEIPIGQSGSKDKRSAIMKNYRTAGTPWTIVIDKEGVVKYNAFHIKPDQGIALIDGLRKLGD